MPPASSIGNRSPSLKADDETAPLLSYVEPAPIAEPYDHPNQLHQSQNGQHANYDEDEDRPLPKAQVVLLCFASCVAPIAFFSIIPYITFMIERVGGVNKEDVGFYAGLTESLFSATQMCVMILWGKVGNLCATWLMRIALLIQLLGL